jgi:hypothetical protein
MGCRGKPGTRESTGTRNKNITTMVLKNPKAATTPSTETLSKGTKAKTRKEVQSTTREITIGLVRASTFFLIAAWGSTPVTYSSSRKRLKNCTEWHVMVAMMIKGARNAYYYWPHNLRIG